MEIEDRYELGPVIGRGGMGVVHRARDCRVGRDVAIKIMRDDLAGDHSVRRRFCDEAVAAARINNPHAVLVFDAGAMESQPFVVMELLSGRTLADELRAGPLDPERVRRYALETLDALADAHAQGIVHRDVKPGNLLLTSDDHVKVADFGIAKITEQPDITLTGEVLGTAAYLAPERLAGETGTPASDIYSLGVVMYEALTGRRPFAGDSPIALGQAIHAGNAPRVRSVRPEIDAALSAVVERAMQKKPEARFASASEMAAALRREHLDLPTEQLDVEAAPTRAMPVQPAAATPARPARRRVPAAAFVVAAIAAVLAAGLLGATQLEGETPPTPTTVAPVNPDVTLPPPVADALSELEESVQR